MEPEGCAIAPDRAKLMAHRQKERQNLAGLVA
jgi:hypothetical protein